MQISISIISCSEEVEMWPLVLWFSDNPRPLWTEVRLLPPTTGLVDENWCCHVWHERYLWSWCNMENKLVVTRQMKRHVT